MNPQILSFFAKVSFFLKLLGLALGTYGLGHSGLAFWVGAIGGSIMVLGPAAYDVYAAGVAAFKIENTKVEAQAVGVQAGINLVLSRKAVDEAGNVITHLEPGSTPPKQVTEQSAAQIVENFPPEAPIAKV